MYIKEIVIDGFKSYSTRTIIKDFDPQFNAITGLNGSGKSSLLRIMAGIDKDYLGEIHQSPGYSIGLLEQEPKLDDSKTVIEIVREGAQKHVDIFASFF